jgi:hypothetical protein
MDDRFEWLMDPCDWYLIWDNESDAPATSGREILGCASAEEAAKLTAAMNAQVQQREYVSYDTRVLRPGIDRQAICIWPTGTIGVRPSHFSK